MSVETVLIKDILPKHSYTNEKVIYDENDSHLLVYYINYYPAGKLKTQRFQPTKAHLPSKLVLSDEVAIAIGLYFGDGQKSINSKSYQAVRFTNSDPSIIQVFLSFLDSLNVERNHLKAYLSISTNLRHEGRDPLEFWSELTKIPINNFHKIGWRQNKYLDSKVASKGTLTVIYNNSSFRLVFDAIYQHIKQRALQDNKLAQNFVKGVIASDGCVHFNRERFARYVSIAAKYAEDRLYIRQLFNKLKITPNKDNLTEGHESISISGYSNLKRAAELNLCDIHHKKARKLEKAMYSYKNICYRKQEGNLKALNLLKEKEYTVTELAKHLNRKESAIRWYLYSLEEQGQAKRVKKRRTAKTGRYAEVWRCTR